MDNHQPTKIATWDDASYLAKLGRRGVNATGLPWDDKDDQNAMFESVANGTYDALVLEDYILEYGTNSRCDVTVVGTTFNEVGRWGAEPSLLGGRAPRCCLRTVKAHDRLTKACRCDLACALCL